MLPDLFWWLVIPMLGLTLLHSIVNMRLLRRLKPIPLRGKDNGKEVLDVSVLVPARNEEMRIRECLSSLLAQQPPVREIILLDDRSEDATVRIARELGFREEGSRLRLIRGQELPEGWVGKNWACHQLSLAADKAGRYLLFTDADTIHGPACLRSALAHAERGRFDLLSLWPDQITGTWAEKLVIPLGYLLFMAFQPFPMMGWLQACPERVKRWGFSRKVLASMGAANGQFLLFRRSSYESLGGHEALKGHLVEDIAFGRQVASRTGEGMRLANADGINLLSCRMYSGFFQLWEGFSKNLRPVFEESFLGFLLFGILVSTLFLLPFSVLPLVLICKEVAIPSLVSVLLILVMRLLLTLRFRTSWLGVVAHPLAVALALLIALNSWRLCRGGGVSWKGRNYPLRTGSGLQ